MKEITLDSIIIGCSLNNLIKAYIDNIPIIYTNILRPLEYDHIKSDKLYLFGFIKDKISKRDLFDRLLFLLNLRGIDYGKDCKSFIINDDQNNIICKYLNFDIKFNIKNKIYKEKYSLYNKSIIEDKFHVKHGPVYSYLSSTLIKTKLSKQIFLLDKTQYQYNTIISITESNFDSIPDIITIKSAIEDKIEKLTKKEIFCEHIERNIINSEEKINLSKLEIKEDNPNYLLIKKLCKKI